MDGYSGFKSLLAGHPPGTIWLALPLGLLPEALYDIHQETGSPLAEERYAGSASSTGSRRRSAAAPPRSGRGPAGRSKPIVEALHAWLTVQLERVFGRSNLAEAIRYALRHWPGLVLFLDDGRLELDTNTVERAIRPIALGRKNSLFAGSDGGARHRAIVASFGDRQAEWGEPQAWLTDLLERVVSGRTRQRAREAAALGLADRAARDGLPGPNAARRLNSACFILPMVE